MPVISHQLHQSIWGGEPAGEKEAGGLQFHYPAGIAPGFMDVRFGARFARSVHVM